MPFRNHRFLLISAVVILFALSVIDIWARKVEVLELFGEQFLNEQKTEAHLEKHHMVQLTAQKQLEITRQDIKEVRLATVGGKISIKQTPDQTIKLHYKVTVSADTQQEAQLLKDAIEVKAEFQNGSVTLVPKHGEALVDYDDVSIDYELLVPQKAQLNVENVSGTVRIAGVSGGVKAKSERGMLELINVKGDISVTAFSSSLYMYQVEGRVKLNNEWSQVTIDQSKGPVEFDSRSGLLTLSRIHGSITGKTHYTPVYVREVQGPVHVEGQQSTMYLDQIEGDSHITSELGTVTFVLPEEIGYSLQVFADRSTIQTELPFPIEQVEEGDYTSSMKGAIGKGTWKVHVKGNASDLNFHIKD